MLSQPKLSVAALASVACCIALATAIRAERTPPSAESAPPAEKAADLLPSIARPELVAASLDALRGHGWDLETPAVSKHTILCRDLEVCDEVEEWASQNSFTPRPALTIFGHGGEPGYSIDVTRTGLLSPEAVHAQGQEIFEGVAGIDGAVYIDWMAERAQ